MNKRKVKYLHWIEYNNKHYIALGKNGSPWTQKVQIRLPIKICKFLNLKF